MGALKSQVSRLGVYLGGGVGTSLISLPPFPLPLPKLPAPQGRVVGTGGIYPPPPPSPQSFTEPEEGDRGRA